MTHEFVEGVETPKVVTLDLDIEFLKRLKIGQEISILLKGVVRSLHTPPDLPDESNPASFSIRITKQTIQGLNDFGLLVEDEDEE